MKLALVFLASAIFLGIPISRILPKVGLPPGLAVLAVFPIMAVVLLWLAAFWPNEERT